MSGPRAPVGDTHNFGRRVTVHEGRVDKPRTVFWEWLLLAKESPLRARLDELAERAGSGRETFGFLPDLAFEGARAPHGGTVERLALAPLPEPSPALAREVARVAGRALALYAWLGLADLHWENLALGLAPDGRVVFAPLDVEMILADLALPTETKLLPDADPEYADLCRHAAGVRRALPFLGKPTLGEDLVAMAAAYLEVLALLHRHGAELAEVIAGLPELSTAPIRVCLRATADYFGGRTQHLWPPLLHAEREQLARGDVPYFFRLYGRPGIHYYGDASLATVRTLPREGDVPQLEPLLELARGLRSPSRASLREQGVFTLLGAFDHRGLRGTCAADGLEVDFRGRSLVLRGANGEELEAPRELRAVVGSVYLPCRCGEVREPLVPAVTRCEAARPPRKRPRERARQR